MSRDCQKTKEKLIDIIENNIPESEKKGVQDHLAACSRCNQLIQSFARAWEELGTAEKLKPSDRFWPVLSAKIQDYERLLPLRDKILAVLRNSLRPAILSLILLFGVYFGYQLGNRPRIKTTLSEMSHIEQYVQDFLDNPEGSVSDFISRYEIPIKDEKP
jgi:predicted anti-sigma-YlaC factor YlaD